MQIRKLYRLCLLSALLLTGCEPRVGLAPVYELKWQPQSGSSVTHKVQKGETLYAVAFRYDQDYRQLARYNHLQSPYTLRVGQVLQLTPYKQTTFTPPSYQRNNTNSSLSNQQIASQVRSLDWFWPASGRVAAGFNPNQGKKGIDIAGKKGEVIRAASAGTVAYAGSGLLGYGNLIIIKHSDQFLTAYGDNLRNRVVEGQRVQAGQIIAEMGVVDRRFWGVHFEIRKNGRPVNPLSYLRTFVRKKV